MDNKIICSLCGKEILEEKSNNPWPIRNNGRCCDVCNVIYVLKTRQGLNYVSNRSRQNII